MTKHSERKIDVGLVVKADMKAKHRVLFPSTILAAIVGILATLLVPSLSNRIRVVLAGVVLTTLLVLILNNKARYSLIMFLRRVDQRFAATKTYDEKKPASHDD